MKIRTKGGLLPLIAGFALLASGCNLEVLNPGAILDEDLNTPDLMPIVVAGASAELNDVGDGYAFTGGRLTDDLSGTGSYFSTGQDRLGIFDFLDSRGFWEQTHEAAWASGKHGSGWRRYSEMLRTRAKTRRACSSYRAWRTVSWARTSATWCTTKARCRTAQLRSTVL